MSGWSSAQLPAHCAPRCPAPAGTPAPARQRAQHVGEGKVNISQLYTCPHKLTGKQLGALCSTTRITQHPKKQEAAKPLPGQLLMGLYMADPCTLALPEATGSLGHGPCPCGLAGSEQQQSWDPAPSRLPGHNLQVPHADREPLGDALSKPSLVAYTGPQLPQGKGGTHPPTVFLHGAGKCAQTLWDVGRCRAGSRSRAGRTVLPALRGAHLSPFPWREEERVCRHPLPSLQTLSCAHSLSACPSAAAAVSHLTFSSPLSRARSCFSIARLSNSETGQGHPRRLLPLRAANLHVRNSPF